MQHYRVGVNDYVLTTSNGPRELLFISWKGHSGHFAMEQSRRPDTPAEDSKTTYEISHRHRRQFPSESLYLHSLKLIRGFNNSVTVITTPKLMIERYQFDFPNSIKWAPYRIDGKIYFAPYKIAPLSTADILLKPEPAKLNIKRISEPEVVEALELLAQEVSNVSRAT